MTKRIASSVSRARAAKRSGATKLSSNRRKLRSQVLTSNENCDECERPKPVTSKAQFVELYQRGVFGNRAPTWDTFGEYAASGYWGPIHFRNRIAGGPTWYNVQKHQAWFEFCRVCAEGHGRNLYFSGMAPHDKNLLQGEVWQSEEHLTLTYSTLPNLPMRDALAQGLQTAGGIRAVVLLRSYMCPNSWEWLNILLDLYKDHVIEFSTFSVEWGTISGYNTVFWEIRHGY